MTWHRSCHSHASRCMMACAKDGTQAAIGIQLKSTLLSFCPVFCFVLCCFVCLVVFCVFCFLWFCFVCFLLVCARSRQLDSFMDYVKVHTSSLFVAFHAYQFNFRQVKACVTTWRKPRRRWTEKRDRCSRHYEACSAPNSCA